ncbi:putative type-1 restriction enzyme specificity protein [compost metagenome]
MSKIEKTSFVESQAGWIPECWTANKLVDLVDVEYGKSPAEINRFDDGFPIFGTGGISGYTDIALHDGPSIILGRKGTINKVQFSDGPFWAIDTTFYTKPKTKFDINWLFYSISTFDLRKLNEASGVPSLSRASLEKLDIATPSLREQKKIASILGTVDDKLNVIARLIFATQTLKQGLMQTLFKRGIGKQDATGQWAPHTIFKKHKTINYPDSWKIVSLGNVAPIVRRPVEIKADAFYPELGLRSFGKGTFHKPALSGAEVGKKRLFKIQPGDLLFSNVFAWEGSVAVARTEDEGRFGSHRYITCKVDNRLANTSFIFRYITTPDGIELLRLASPGGAGRNRTLGLSALAAISIPLPPLNEQNKITEILDGVDAKLCMLISKQTHYQSLKRGLMQKLLTGEWRV